MTSEMLMYARRGGSLLAWLDVQQLAVHTFATMWLLFNIYFNYALCIASDPVRPCL